MSTNKSIVPVLGIESAAQFWMEIAQPNFLRFHNDPTAREAFNLCSSLWHLIDWVQIDHRTNPQNLSLRELRKQFETECTALSALHDITTVSKHGTIEKPRGIVSSSKANIQGVNFYFSSLGPVSEHPASYTIQLANGQEVLLHELLASAYSFWDKFFRPPQASVK
jgi:hypothetical protein